MTTRPHGRPAARTVGVERAASGEGVRENPRHHPGRHLLCGTISTKWVRRAVTAVAAAAAVTVAPSACTVTFGHPDQSRSAKVSKEALQNDISQRLTAAGQTPHSVTCPSDLVGQPGQSTRCEVTMGPANSFEPIATVTSLDGSKVNYDVTPSVSKTQLESAVSQMAAKSSKAPIESVSCQSGLDGKVGAVAHCDVTTQGVTTQRTVEVTAVSGLAMKYGLVSVLPKAVVESSLVFQLKQVGQHPDSASCAGDLEGKLDNTIECTTLSGGQTQTYTLSVTAMQGDNITYKYTPKP